MIPDENLLTAAQVKVKIMIALKEQQPFSLVRVGDGENIVMAQESVWPLEKVLKTRWARDAGLGKKGVNLPNLRLRDQMIEAIRKADIVGIPYQNNDPIMASWKVKRPLTDELFSFYQLAPQQLCHTFVNRWYAHDATFWNMFSGKKLLIIYQYADDLKKVLQQLYDLHIPVTLPFSHYDQMEKTLETLAKEQEQFDAAIISCGVNAVVLATQIAERFGKVAIDFGKSSQFILKLHEGILKKEKGE